MRRAIGAERKAVCFECYKADARRQRAFETAASLNTGSAERLQFGLPFEAVDRPRLARLKAERASSRQQLRVGAGRFVDKRRQAQIAARHSLQRIAEGVRVRRMATSDAATAAGAATATGAARMIDADRELAMAIHAAELQLPDAWLPFVVAR